MKLVPKEINTISLQLYRSLENYMIFVFICKAFDGDAVGVVVVAVAIAAAAAVAASVQPFGNLQPSK